MAVRDDSLMRMLDPPRSKLLFDSPCGSRGAQGKPQRAAYSTVLIYSTNARAALAAR
jgi:hypothetical protein